MNSRNKNVLQNILFQQEIKAVSEAATRNCSLTNDVLKNFAKFTGKHLFQVLFFKKDTVAEEFFCEFCEISKNTYFTEHLWSAASAVSNKTLKAAVQRCAVKKLFQKSSENSQENTCCGVLL